MNWKPASEIPTEHWDRNHAISPEYIVLCEGKSGYDNNLPVIGISRYSFYVNDWVGCCNHIGTPETILKVVAWTEDKFENINI